MMMMMIITFKFLSQQKKELPLDLMACHIGYGENLQRNLLP